MHEMDPAWTTTILLLPCLVVLTAGFFYLYGFISALLTKTTVRNKVVVISDSLSGLGKGNSIILCVIKRTVRWRVIVESSIAGKSRCSFFNDNNS